MFIIVNHFYIKTYTISPFSTKCGLNSWALHSLVQSLPLASFSSFSFVYSSFQQNYSPFPSNFRDGSFWAFATHFSASAVFPS